MTILFTNEEKKWLSYDPTREYPYNCKKGAPERIKESITQKIEAHKNWLKKIFGKG